MLAFPSPGGDVLRLGIRRSTETVLSVSVPWRGCVASQGNSKDDLIARKSFRPLVGMCCVISADDIMAFYDEFPSPGGDVLRHIISLIINSINSFRPLAGMCCVQNRFCVNRFFSDSFRPLAGMCCVGKFAQNDLLKKKLFMLFAFFCNIL